MKNYFFKENIAQILYARFLRFIFKLITKKHLPFFTRGGDLMSVDPQIFGIYEPIITKLISSFARKGYDDFLIDIGANIGLTTCQNGNAFKVVHMFEPNPLCRKILEVNTSIAQLETRATIHSYGLGEKSHYMNLMVPRHNWGGGYIDSKENSYGIETLVKKDGFLEFSEKNYLKLNVEIRESCEVFRILFAQLKDCNNKKGVIKIDVEGYEPHIIKAIATTLPKDLEVFIIFESFNPNLDLSNILNLFNERASVFKIIKLNPISEKIPRLIRILGFILKNDYLYYLSNVNKNWDGDIVLKISSAI